MKYWVEKYCLIDKYNNDYKIYMNNLSIIKKDK